MRALALAAALLLGPSLLASQVAVHVSLGARTSGALVHDSIVTAFDVRPALAPAVSAGVELPGHRGWAAGAALDYSRSDVPELGDVGALSFMVSLRRELPAGLGVRLTAGGLKYFSARDAGVFRGGTGAPFPLLGVALDWAPPNIRSRGFVVEVRADAHRFITQALRDEGFDEHRLVPRVAVAIRADLARLW